jgi:hypothetical protein
MILPFEPYNGTSRVTFPHSLDNLVTLNFVLKVWKAHQAEQDEVDRSVAIIESGLMSANVHRTSMFKDMLACIGDCCDGLAQGMNYISQNNTQSTTSVLAAVARSSQCMKQHREQSTTSVLAAVARSSQCMKQHCEQSTTSVLTAVEGCYAALDHRVSEANVAWTKQVHVWNLNVMWWIRAVHVVMVLLLTAYAWNATNYYLLDRNIRSSLQEAKRANYALQSELQNANFALQSELRYAQLQLTQIAQVLQHNKHMEDNPASAVLATTNVAVLMALKVFHDRTFFLIANAYSQSVAFVWTAGFWTAYNFIDQETTEWLFDSFETTVTTVGGWIRSSVISFVTHDWVWAPDQLAPVHL